MKIVLNGTEKEVNDHTRLDALLADLKLPLDAIAVERNRAIVDAQDYAATALVAGDALEIVRFVGGG
jgi:thiamine biosynthesis protein ThiS